MITKFIRAGEETEEQKKQAMEAAEKYFGTAEDPEQIPVSDESRQKLGALSPDWDVIAVDEHNQIVGWAVTVPTTLELMEKFLKKEISERELLDYTKPQENYSALYISTFFVSPEHRRKGYATKIFEEMLRRFDYQNKKQTLFAWIYSKDGEELIKSIATKFNLEIKVRV